MSGFSLLSVQTILCRNLTKPKWGRSGLYTRLMRLILPVLHVISSLQLTALVSVFISNSEPHVRVFKLFIFLNFFIFMVLQKAPPRLAMFSLLQITQTSTMDCRKQRQLAQSSISFPKPSTLNHCFFGSELNKAPYSIIYHRNVKASSLRWEAFSSTFPSSLQC